MINVTFKTNNTDAVIDELRSKVELALMQCGSQAENYAKIDAPVDTGRLRNSIGHEMRGENTVAIGSGVRTGDSVEYAVYQEFGTSRGIKPKYFLTNAIRNHIEEYKSIIQNILK